MVVGGSVGERTRAFDPLSTKHGLPNLVISCPRGSSHHEDLLLQSSPDLLQSSPDTGTKIVNVARSYRGEYGANGIEEVDRS